MQLFSASVHRRTGLRMAEIIDLWNCIVTALAEDGCSTSEQKVLLEELTGQTLR